MTYQIDNLDLPTKMQYKTYEGGGKLEVKIDGHPREIYLTEVENRYFMLCSTPMGDNPYCLNTIIEFSDGHSEAVVMGEGAPLPFRAGIILYTKAVTP
jgi:hypothetical protein